MDGIKPGLNTFFPDKEKQGRGMDTLESIRSRKKRDEREEKSAASPWPYRLAIVFLG